MGPSSSGMKVDIWLPDDDADRTRADGVVLTATHGLAAQGVTCRIVPIPSAQKAAVGINPLNKMARIFLRRPALKGKTLNGRAEMECLSHDAIIVNTETREVWSVASEWENYTVAKSSQADLAQSQFSPETVESWNS